MMYNHQQFSKQNERKVLHKVKKNWVVMSVASFALIGGIAFASENNTLGQVSADDATQTTQVDTKQNFSNPSQSLENGSNQSATALTSQVGAASSYEYANLASDGSVQTDKISWQHNDGDQLDTGWMDYAQGNAGKASISFTINGGKTLKAGDTIRIPVKTNLANQPGTQTFGVSNLNPVINDDEANQSISKSVSFDQNTQEIVIPLDGSNFNANQTHRITLNFNTAGGMVFPKSASNGADLSFSETIADQTHNYHWAAKPTAPNFSENNTLGTMQDLISSQSSDGVELRATLFNSDGKPFTQPVLLNNGQDYIQTIDVNASTTSNGQEVPVDITPGTFSPYVAVSQNFGPATEAAGWTDQAANNWGGTSNAGNRIANWFNQDSSNSATPAENSYSIIKVSDSHYKVVINYGKQQTLAYSKAEFETIIKSQYAHVSDAVIQEMESRYSDGKGNVVIPYSIQASIQFKNPNNKDGQVKYSANFSDNKGVSDNKHSFTTPMNDNTTEGETKVLVHYQDEQGNQIAADSKQLGFEKDNNTYSAKSVQLDHYTLDTSKLPEGATSTGDGQYAVNGPFKADWQNGVLNITYVYKADPASAKVRYVLDKDGDTNTNNDWEQLDEKTINGSYGEAYQTQANDYSSKNYYLVEVINGPDGTFDGTSDQTITYVYAQNRNLTVNYLDQDNNNQKIDGDTYTYVNKNGHCNALDSYRTAATIQELENKGYELVTDPYPAAGYTFGSDLNQTFNVVLKHKHVDTTETKTATRTINYVDQDTGQQVANTVTQPVTFTRTVTKDAVTGQEISTGAWTQSGSWSEVDSPSVAGYNAPDKAKVDADNSLNADNATDQTVTVKYSHKTNVTTETKTVTRTIKYEDASDNHEIHAEVTQPVTFTRTKTVDEKTGNVTYGDWTQSGSWSEVDSPSIDGYDAPDRAKVDAANVTADMSDDTEVVKYNQKKDATTETRVVTRTIKYVDKVDQHEIHAEVNQAITFTRPVEKNEATGQVTPTGPWTQSGSWGAVQSPSIDGYAAPDRASVPADSTVTADTKDDTEVVQYAHGTAEKTETKTATRTIKYVDKSDGHEVAKTVTQLVTFKKDVTIDTVTGQVTKDGTWTPDSASWAEVTSPAVDGYDAPDKAKVDAENVTADTKDENVTVTYQKKASTPVTPNTPNTPSSSDTPSASNTPSHADNGAASSNGRATASKNHSLPATAKQLGHSVKGLALLGLGSLAVALGLKKKD
ncbi:mucin-binding protein [Fructobacillus durionis]|uniref:KxYKxGKxW signal peptide containing protein n=1 Tax=Fructobacillus durionis TaxID=283737 RepID=A0A1I1H7K2_9LACO|nr:MucBP domain-containing protein [Fructobacillus durionis]SFC19801.1 KxYKxGKxW signal peptide containing protein [Fructobacillus durionis]